MRSICRIESCGPHMSRPPYTWLTDRVQRLLHRVPAQPNSFKVIYIPGSPCGRPQRVRPENSKYGPFFCQGMGLKSGTRNNFPDARREGTCSRTVAPTARGGIIVCIFLHPTQGQHFVKCSSIHQFLSSFIRKVGIVKSIPYCIGRRLTYRILVDSIPQPANV